MKATAGVPRPVGDPCESQPVAGTPPPARLAEELGASVPCRNAGGRGRTPPPLSGVLLDERSGTTVRHVIGLLLTRAREADFAVARIRLGAVDLTAAELARVRRCRVLLGRLDVQSLAAAPDGHAASLAGLLGFLRSGRIEVRSAGGSGWTADFSVFRGLPPDPVLPLGHACLVGAHSFWNVDAAAGPSFTCMLGSPGATVRATRRFEELWCAAYDVLPVLIQTIVATLDAHAGASRHAAICDRGAPQASQLAG